MNAALFFFFFLPTLLSTVHCFSAFTKSVTDWLESEKISWRLDYQNPLSSQTHHPLLEIFPFEHGIDPPASSFFIHLLPSPIKEKDCVGPTVSWDMTNQATLDGQSLIHLHQDVWRAKTDIVRSRLLVRLGKTRRRIFARKTTVQRIDATLALPFLQEHHLWSATKAKYYYGLWDDNGDLVAVATFSSRRNVLRNGVPHRSHELVRFCSRRDEAVVGGITKLVTAFIREHEPDDIVTVVDRDWGPGSGWYKLGFETVHWMPPLSMVVGADDGKRRHLVGAGIRPGSSSGNEARGRQGLEQHILEELEMKWKYNDVLQCLKSHGFYTVYDAGVERLIMIVRKALYTEQIDEDGKPTVLELWENSVPKYASTYYSSNRGVAALLKNAEIQTRTQFTSVPSSIFHRRSVDMCSK